MKSWLLPGLLAGMGVPLIIADAASTSSELDTLDRPAEARREARCVGLVRQTGLSPEPGQTLCRCIVREARRRGVDGPHGSYDARLPEVIAYCEGATGIRIA